MKVFAIIAAVILVFAVISCQRKAQSSQMISYAAQFDLTPTSQPEQRFWNRGPFYLRSDHEQIWTMNVITKDGKTGNLWVRFGLVDDVYLLRNDSVDKISEINLK